jgi:hypothetical protein
MKRESERERPKLAASAAHTTPKQAQEEVKVFSYALLPGIKHTLRKFLFSFYELYFHGKRRERERGVEKLMQHKYGNGNEVKCK